MDLKKRIKEYIPVTELAKKMGVSQPSVSKMLSGNPTLDNLRKIADIIGIPVSELLSEGKDMTALIEYKGQTYSAHDFKKLRRIIDELERGDSPA